MRKVTEKAKKIVAYQTSKPVVRELLKREVIKLNVGCGTDYKEGWVNIDNNSDNNIKKLDLHWDLRNPLPFPEQSIDFIFNEHFMEHLTPEEARYVMPDLMRVLKPGGVMRVAMPDLGVIVNNYVHVPLDKDPTIQEFHMDSIKTRAEWINISFRSWGHKWLYDWEELERRFNELGLHNIKRCKLKKSEHKELNNLEIRNGSLLIAEITK